MSSKSNDQGRAFEYACITELEERIKDKKLKYGKLADRAMQDLKKIM